MRIYKPSLKNLHIVVRQAQHTWASGRVQAARDDQRRRTIAAQQITLDNPHLSLFQRKQLLKQGRANLLANGVSPKYATVIDIVEGLKDMVPYTPGDKNTIRPTLTFAWWTQNSHVKTHESAKTEVHRTVQDPTSLQPASSVAISEVLQASIDMGFQRVEETFATDGLVEALSDNTTCAEDEDIDLEMTASHNQPMM